MIMVEPGSPKGFRYIHSFREWIINTKSRDEANIVGPCPHHKECPMARSVTNWCHFSQIT
jgi:ribosomal protein RSM22 (predicted rRNA methylase)